MASLARSVWSVISIRVVVSIAAAGLSQYAIRTSTCDRLKKQTVV
jgi:hypothetical protein